MNAFSSDKFAEYLGLEMLSAAQGSSAAKLDIKPHHLNGAGIVHGGAIYSLAVWALALAANSADIGSDICVGTGGTINYVSNVSQGTLYACAKPVHIGKHIVTYQVTVTGDNERIIAVLQGSGYRRKNIE
jgi:acyl-CoA thioesterase